MALLMAGLAACSSDSYGTLPIEQPPTTSLQVDATPALTFTPQALTVKVGDTVTFAFGSVPHNVFFDPTAGAPADIEGRNTNAVFKRKFTTSGTYRYNCHVHPGMTGVVTVTGTTPAVPAQMVFVLRTANGAPPPALIDHFGQGVETILVNILADSLVLDGKGGYRQVALIESRQAGVPVGVFRYFDRGHYTIEGLKLHGISDYLEDVRLEANLGNDGFLRLIQALIPTGLDVLYELKPLPEQAVGGTGSGY